MPDPHAQFTGSVPELYERHLGPVIFEPYADDLARRVADFPIDGAVLELACGTGILTRRLRARLQPGIRLVASDLNPPMLALAQAQVGDSTAIEWRQADAGALPFASAAFAAVVCQFGFMFVPDKAAAFSEARRVLSEGGLLAFNVWDSLAHNPFARLAHAVIGGFFASNPPNFYEVPFGFHDRELIRTLLQASGFEQVQIEPVVLPTFSPAAASFALGLVRGNPVAAELGLRGVSIDAVVEAVTAALSAEGGNRPFRSTMQALVVTARAAATD